MKFTVYSKKDCPFCYKIKTVLELCGKDYEIHMLDEDFTKDEFYTQFGKGSTFPQVVLDKETLGGCTDTIKYLREISLI